MRVIWGCDSKMAFKFGTNSYYFVRVRLGQVIMGGGNGGGGAVPRYHKLAGYSPPLLKRPVK